MCLWRKLFGKWLEELRSKYTGGARAVSINVVHWETRMKTNYLIVLAILTAAGCSRTDQPQESAHHPRAVVNSPNLLEEAEFNKASAIEQRLQGLLKSGPVEELARAIAEVDEWLIAPDEEAQVRKLIDAAVDELRLRITSEVTALANAAIAARKGSDASAKLSNINSLLVLYPGY